MSKVSTKQQTKTDVVETAAPFRWPDANSTAQLVLDEGLTFCARKAGLDSVDSVVESLREGNSNVSQYCRYGLAKKVAEAVGQLDENVKAVYTLDYDATPEDRCFGSDEQASLIHLVVWAGRKTDALDALVKALDRALVQAYSDLVDAPQLTHLLDVQIVDDADVEGRLGYGALLSSIHNRPIKVWER